MKVICINQCQKDRKILFKNGNEYDIEEEMFEKNKEYFKPVEKVATKKDK